jgi:ribosomal protein S18 acetylase RimI-like enzyme
MNTTRFEPTPDWIRAMEDPDAESHCLLVAQDRERVIGWCRLFCLSGNTGAGGECEVGIGLLPEYRGQGWGRELLSHGLAWAAHRGLRQAILTTKVDNLRAIRLFKRCGFQEVDSHKDGWLSMVCRVPLLGGRGNG